VDRDEAADLAALLAVAGKALECAPGKSVVLTADEAAGIYAIVERTRELLSPVLHRHGASGSRGVTAAAADGRDET